MKKIAITLVTTVFTGLAWAQVDLNQATEIDLDGLNGLGPAITRQVLNERHKAPFRDWADLLHRVKGMGPKKAAQLSAQGLQIQGLGYLPKLESSANPR